MPGGTGLIAGKMWQTVVANRMTSRTATTNSGSAASSSIAFEVTMSKDFSRRSAAHEPMAIDSGIADQRGEQDQDGRVDQPVARAPR